MTLRLATVYRGDVPVSYLKSPVSGRRTLSSASPNTSQPFSCCDVHRILIWRWVAWTDCNNLNGFRQDTVDDSVVAHLALSAGERDYAWVVIVVEVTLQAVIEAPVLSRQPHGSPIDGSALIR